MAKRLPHPINRALIEKIAAASKTSELNSGKVVAVGPGSHDGIGKLSAVSWNEGGEKNLEVGVYAYSSAHVKKAIDIVDNLYAVFLQARFFEAAVAYKKTIGFNGTLCIEPNPQGPTKHQYDRDAATSANFLRKYGLIDEFKLSIECNNATLSSHSEHLSEVRERNPAIANGEDSGSVKPFRFLEEQDGSNAWMNGAALPSEDNKWNAGGSTER